MPPVLPSPLQIPAILYLKKGPCRNFLPLRKFCNFPKSIIMLRYFLLLLTFSCSFSMAQDAALLVGHLIDPEMGTTTEDQVILIENKRIVQILPYDEFNEKGGTPVYDLRDAWVMPGLMDTHVHLTYNAPYGQFQPKLTYMNESTALRALRGAKNARDLLHAGFTTVKEIGNDAEYATADLIKAINNGWMEGPTIQYAGKIIAPFGGQIGGVNQEQGKLWQYEYIEATTPEEIRKAIHQNVYYGANTIKLVTDAQPFFYREEDIRAAVEEADRLGLKVAVHCDGGEAARNVILGGAAAIEHGFGLDREMLALMKEHGTFLSGTDFAQSHLMAMGMPEASAAAFGQVIIKRLKMAYEMGVNIAFSTDVVVDLPGMNRAQSNLEFLEVWKAAEIPPAFTLKSMTTQAAVLMDLDQVRGHLKPGYFADIIATPGNPLEDIDQLKHVHFVMKEGTLIRHQTQPARSPALRQIQQKNR